MITTNMPALVQQLSRLAEVTLHDTLDQLSLLVSKPVDIAQVDDLLCDALFVEPQERKEHERAYTIDLLKLDKLRHAGDLQVRPGRYGRMTYLLR